mmetsp:Transcript_37162/g.54359  ORF Transcript_37162/g.54359 Transcript_37162/m.54359 type:complete len:87 (-) Transcript_37162:65-325(-)
MQKLGALPRSQPQPTQQHQQEATTQQAAEFKSQPSATMAQYPPRKQTNTSSSPTNPKRMSTRPNTTSTWPPLARRVLPFTFRTNRY